MDKVYAGGVRSVCEDSAGRFWFGDFGNGLGMLDRGTKTFTTFKPSTSDPTTLSSSFIERVHVDLQGNLWVGTADGVNLLSNWRKNFRLIANSTDNLNSLVDGEVHTIMEDSRGDRWIGTYGGRLSRWVQKTGQFINYTIGNVGPSPIVSVVYEDRGATIWVGTNSTDGLVRWDRNTDTFFKDSLAERGDRRNWVTAIMEDSLDAFWVGTGRGICRYDRNTRRKRWYRLDSSEASWVHAIYIDHSKRVWVCATLGAFGGESGLYEYDRVHDLFVKRQNVNASSIYEDRTNRMWLGALGLMLYERSRDSLISVLTASVGLGGRDVYGMLEDERGNLWLSTDKGLSKYNPDSHTVRNYGINDGFPFFGINHTGGDIKASIRARMER